LAKLESKDLALACARLADEKKAEDIIVLHVAPLTTIADYFVIATGYNTRQISAIASDLASSTKKEGAHRLGTEGTAESGWVLIDLGTVVVHLFDVLRRDLYSLELLWGDAETVAWASSE
jgi:ribosome-associated protein